MTVKDILERVTTLYNDVDYIRVPKQQYLQFLDDAINQLILSRPDAHVKTSVVKLTKGTRQSIPADGYSLIDIYMNKTLVSPGVYDNGAPVFQVERKDLDYFSDWHSVSANPTEITEFTYDLRTPRTFFVSPPVGNNDVYVEMDYSYGADQFALMTSDWATTILLDIPVNDVYRGPLVSYILFLLYSTDSTSTYDRQIAQRYEASFYQSLGLEYKAAALVVPKIDADVQVTNTGGAQ